MSRCVACRHFHTGRVCNVTKVSGPPVDNDRDRLSEADQHRGRTVTKCDCKLRPPGE